MPSDYIGIERELLKSKAFSKLSGTGKTVYFHFRMKCQCKTQRNPGRKKETVILNNGEIVFPYAEAETKWNIPRTTFMRALNELVAKGFIDVAWSGSGGRKGDVSKYAISKRWRHYDTPLFEYATRSKDMRAGRGFQPGNKEWQKAKRANIGVKSGNPTIAKNGNPKRRK
jgi:hypothetical protein